MKKIFFILSLVALSIASCSKEKEGCNDSSASNYDNQVVVDDGSCTYTALTFYADSSEYQGKLITTIEIIIDGESIGDFSGSYLSGSQVCDASNTVVYDTQGATSISWNAIINQSGGTSVSTSGIYSGITTETCVIQQVLPNL
jgi:hypothetical protein